jgi:hypothetical protein
MDRTPPRSRKPSPPTPRKKRAQYLDKTPPRSARRPPPTPRKNTTEHDEQKSSIRKIDGGYWLKRPSVREISSYLLLKSKMFDHESPTAFTRDAPSVLNLPLSIITDPYLLVKTTDVGYPITYLVEEDIKRLSQGLDYLHKNGILHGDVQPRNICRNVDDQVYLIDFGSVGYIGSKVLEIDSSYIGDDDGIVTLSREMESDDTLAVMKLRLLERSNDDIQYLFQTPI